LRTEDLAFLTGITGKRFEIQEQEKIWARKLLRNLAVQIKKRWNVYREVWSKAFFREPFKQTFSHRTLGVRRLATTYENFSSHSLRYL
jgi:hypothetical protein